MALGIVGACGGLTKKEMSDCLFVGELSLDGGVCSVRGARPIAIEARGRKISRMVVPEANAKEAAMVAGVDVYPVRSLLDVIHFVKECRRKPPDRRRPKGRPDRRSSSARRPHNRADRARACRRVSACA
jgi:predicted ATPase with chaperone activity